jgi:hypothetical protein
MGNRLGLALAVALALVAPDGARAQTVSACTSAKQKAAGKYVQAVAACRAKALKKGTPVDPVCLGKAELALTKGFDKAEGKDDCLAHSEAGLTQAVAQSFLASLGTVLEPGPGICCAGASTCVWAPDAEFCIAFGETPGEPGSVCAGDGSCVVGGTTPGLCCEDIFVPPSFPCANGLESTGLCAGDVVPNGVCLGGSCIALP